MTTFSGLRVAIRFGARQMKPEKLEALLLKLRKGAATSIKMFELAQVLEALGGYTISEEITLEPQGGKYVRKEELQRYTHPHPGNVQTMWDRAKHDEVTSLPEHPQLHHVYYMDVSDLMEEGGQKFFTYRAWQGRAGVRIKSPDGKTFDVQLAREQFLDSYPTNTGVLKWLREHTPFLKQVNDRLGTVPIEQEREEKKQKIPTRENTGTCPVCFNNIKLRPTARKAHDKTMPGMTLHGYKRPGTGYLHGECFGIDYPPFELSAEGSHAFIAELDKNIANIDHVLQKYKSGAVTELFVDRNQKLVHVVKAEVPAHEWDGYLKEKIRETDAQKDWLTTTKAFVKRRADSWKLEPLPGTPPV
jgi:hypothetical protein